MLSLVLAASLWSASMQERVAPPQAYVTVPVERISDAVAVDLVFIGVGTALDLISTDRAINRGCVEGNPLVPRVEGRIGVKIGAAAIRASGAYLLRRTGHGGTAGVLRWLGAAWDGGVTVNNELCGR